MNGGHPTGATFRGTGCEYVDIDRTPKLPDLHQKKGTCERGRGVSVSRGSMAKAHDLNAFGKAGLTVILQCNAVRSVQGQRGPNHLQSVGFLLHFGHEKHISEQKSHHLQLSRDKT